MLALTGRPSTTIELRDRITNAMREYGEPITAGDIADLLGGDRKNISTVVRDMAKKGEIRESGTVVRMLNNVGNSKRRVNVKTFALLGRKFRGQVKKGSRWSPQESAQLKDYIYKTFDDGDVVSQRDLDKIGEAIGRGGDACYAHAKFNRLLPQFRVKNQPIIGKVMWSQKESDILESYIKQNFSKSRVITKEMLEPIANHIGRPVKSTHSRAYNMGLLPQCPVHGNLLKHLRPGNERIETTLLPKLNPAKAGELLQDIHTEMRGIIEKYLPKSLHPMLEMLLNNR